MLKLQIEIKSDEVSGADVYLALERAFPGNVKITVTAIEEYPSNSLAVYNVVIVDYPGDPPIG